jgi:hypothetical protein
MLLVELNGSRTETLLSFESARHYRQIHGFLVLKVSLV